MPEGESGTACDYVVPLHRWDTVTPSTAYLYDLTAFITIRDLLHCIPCPTACGHSTSHLLSKRPREPPAT